MVERKGLQGQVPPELQKLCLSMTPGAPCLSNVERKNVKGSMPTPVSVEGDGVGVKVPVVVKVMLAWRSEVTRGATGHSRDHAGQGQAGQAR